MTKLTIEEVARVCHEVNREYSKSIGDPIKPSWEEAPENQRVSSIKGVEYHLATPNSLPSDSHQSWLNNKVATGWRYGEVISEIHQTHPCMVPYEQLPVTQRAKDFIFLAIVRQLEKIGIEPKAKEEPIQVQGEQIGTLDTEKP